MKFHSQSVPVDFSTPCAVQTPENSKHLIVSEGTNKFGCISAVPAGTRFKGTCKKSVQVVGRKFCEGIHKHLHMHVALDKSAGRPRVAVPS